MLKMFQKRGEQVFRPAAGTVLDLNDVPDPVFASGAAGDGFGLDPVTGSFCSPVDGELILVAKTLHAFAVRTDAGAEILVHIGVDTVKLKGEGFTAHRAKGDRVQRGDLVISCDLDRMRPLVPSLITAVLIANGTDFTPTAPDTDALADSPVLTVRRN